MRKLSQLVFRFTILSIFFGLAATTVVAGEVPPQLAAARTAADQGQGSEAIALYEEFITAHPLMQTVFVRKDEHLPPSQVHDLLLAFAELTEQQRISGDEENRRAYLEKLDWVWRNHSISAINLYHLARVYLDNNSQDQGLAALEKIANDQERFPKEEHNKVYLRACAKLLKNHQEQGHPDEVDNVLRRMRGSLVLFSYDLRDRYKIARLFLEHGAREKAEPMLADIADENDPTTLRVEEFTIVQASVKLLGMYSKRNDGRAIERLLKNLQEKYEDPPLRSRNRHLLDLAMERAGRGPDGKRLAGQAL